MRLGDGVHLCNPDLVRQRGPSCCRTLVTYYYSFSCCSKYWFIKGFSIWAPWHLVKYHQGCRSEERDREGGGQVGSPGIVDYPPLPSPQPSPCSLLVLIYLFNSEERPLLSVWSRWVQHGLIFSAPNYPELLFIFGLSDPLDPVLICSWLLSVRLLMAETLSEAMHLQNKTTWSSRACFQPLWCSNHVNKTS